ncbi:MAG: ATP-binding protein, partial [Anaerolineae bacterium]
RELLRKELDVLPAPETEKLYQVLHRRASPVTVRSEIHLPTLARAPLPDLNVPPLVGRDVERAALLDHLESAARGHGELLLLEGEPGIGKSRLVEETIAGARWRNIDTIRAETEADNSSSYGPLLAVLSQELTPLRLRQLGQIVAPDVLWALSPLLPGISARLEDPSPLADLPPPEAHARLQRALVTVILGLSRIKPRLWVLEDIQWIDAETLALLPRLYPALVESRTLLLITGRCAELRARSVVWDMLQTLDKARPFPRYTLSRLGKDAIIDLLERLLDEDSTELAERLLQESGGVPLYIVEILKAWRDEGCLLPTERGRWRWEGKPPERLSIHLGEKIIDRRLTRLSPDAEAVLKSAAVIGTEVDFDLLADVCALSEAGPDATRPERYLRATDELLGLGFLSETEVGYRFSHEQIRHVVHDRLSIAERQGLHHRVAVSLEEHHPEEFRALARHFAIAGLRSPALHYLNKAIEQARAVFAHRTALTCYQDLLALLIHPEDRATRYDVLGGRAEVLGWIGDRDAQGHDLEEMLHLARELSDEARVAAALHRRSEWHRIQGRYEAAQEDARAALVVYERLGDEKGRAALLGQLGRNLLDAENDPEAIRCLQKALPIHEAADDLVGQIRCLMGLARAAQNRGDLSQAQNYCERSLALAKTTQDPRWISYTLSSVGLGYIDLGDMDAAETYLRQALDLAKRSQGKRRVAITRVRLAHVALQRGDFEAAHHRLQTALQTLHDVQDVSWEGYALSLLGEIDLLRGKIIVAKESLEAAYQRHQALGEHDYAAIDLSYLALVELALGNEETAWQYSQEVITKARAEWPGTTC